MNGQKKTIFGTDYQIEKINSTINAYNTLNVLLKQPNKH